VTRFSDEELHKFRGEFDEHVKEEHSYRDQNDMLLKELLEAQKENTMAIRTLEESTRGVVTLFNEGVVGKTLTIRLGKFILWIAAIYGAIKLLIGIHK